MNSAERFALKNGFSGNEYWHNDEGEYIMQKLSDLEWSAGGVEFVIVSALVDSVKVETTGYMFEDDSMILDLGPRWYVVPPSWETEEVSILEAE